MSGTFTTLYTIVPQEVGNFTIEGTPFVYFATPKAKNTKPRKFPIHLYGYSEAIIR